MRENTSISKDYSYGWIIGILCLIIIVAVSVGLSVGGSSDSSESSGNYVSTSLPITNKFSSTLEGNTGGFKNNFNFEEDVETATSNISDILKDDQIIPLKFIIVDGGNNGVIAAATRNVDNDLYAGGTIYIYSNFSYNLSTTYVEVLMHEILHLMGIGLHRKWASACSNNQLDGKVFPNALAEYNKLTGGNHTNIPIGDSHGHWQESKFGDEMMTPYIAGAHDLKLSRLTGMALLDIGWNINFDSKQFESYSI